MDYKPLTQFEALQWHGLEILRKTLFFISYFIHIFISLFSDIIRGRLDYLHTQNTALVKKQNESISSQAIGNEKKLVPKIISLALSFLNTCTRQLRKTWIFLNAFCLVCSLLYLEYEIIINVEHKL